VCRRSRTALDPTTQKPVLGRGGARRRSQGAEALGQCYPLRWRDSRFGARMTQDGAIHMVNLFSTPLGPGLILTLGALVLSIARQ